MEHVRLACVTSRNKSLVLFAMLFALLVHLVLLTWPLSPGTNLPVARELSVNFAPTPQQRTETVVEPQRMQQPPKESPQHHMSAQQYIAPITVAAASGVNQAKPLLEDGAVPASSPDATLRPMDSEPDYRAAYLDNPLPVYPVLARRMGWQGRVVLNVEVLANGRSGEMRLHQGSGHEVLDNAALQAVSGWRFVPAQQAGQAVNRWFLVPIPFILKDAQ